MLMNWPPSNDSATIVGFNISQLNLTGNSAFRDLGRGHLRSYVQLVLKELSVQCLHRLFVLSLSEYMLQYQYINLDLEQHCSWKR